MKQFVCFYLNVFPDNRGYEAQFTKFAIVMETSNRRHATEVRCSSKVQGYHYILKSAKNLSPIHIMFNFFLVSIYTLKVPITNSD